MGPRPAHLPEHRRMTMIALLLYRTLADHLLPWAMTLASRMLARSLNLPEPLVHSTGDYVVAHVTAFEHSVGRSLCPSRLARLLRAWWRCRH
ncbi:hypothetical protein XH80_18920 [Bradyrhizobium sp. CCBAU 45384]|nr:hypothetical protein [Bradyrhizobium sp. CCBAU 45384]